MNTYRLIPPRCIVSPTARRVYSIAAVLIPVCLVASVWVASIDPRAPYSRFLDGVFELVILPLVVLAIAILLVGMECFLYAYDDSSAWKQSLWFMVNLLVPLGNIVYCFAVYRRKTPMTSGEGSIAAGA